MDECINQRSVNQHWLLPCLGQNGNVSAQGLGPKTEQVLMKLGDTDFANHHLLIQQVGRQQEHTILQTYTLSCGWCLLLLLCDGTSSFSRMLHALLAAQRETFLLKAQRGMGNSQLCHRALLIQGLDI